MSKRERLALFGVAAIAAAGLGWLFYSPILVKEAPTSAKGLMVGANWLLWLFALLPVWLPTVFPDSLPRLLLVSRWLCGVLLLAPLVVLAAMLIMGEQPRHLAALAFASAIVGAWHLTTKLRQSVRPKAEPRP
jgi:hypothetical protein